MPTPDDFVADLPAALRKRAARVRTLVFDRAPNAAEKITWDAISFYNPARGGPIKGSICQLVHRDDQLRLDFPLGYLMDDPTGLLLETVGRKGKRHVDLSPMKPTLAQLSKLIDASLARPDKPKRIPG